MAVPAHQVRDILYQPCDGVEMLQWTRSVGPDINRALPSGEGIVAGQPSRDHSQP